ncbi:hypothetical protein D3C72_702590 [compost metagenome]
MADNNPPSAGPIEKPKFTAIRFSENARVIFSGRAYFAIATELAGRKTSLVMLCINTITAREAGV